MNPKQARVLVVGADTAFQRIFERIESCGCYQFEYAHFLAPAPVLAETKPAAILLLVPEERRSKQQALAWLRAHKDAAPIVVLSVVADMDVYVACMSSGAFDYITGYMPIDEILRSEERRVGKECRL